MSSIISKQLSAFTFLALCATGDYACSLNDKGESMTELHAMAPKSAPGPRTPLCLAMIEFRQYSVDYFRSSYCYINSPPGALFISNPTLSTDLGRFRLATFASLSHTVWNLVCTIFTGVIPILAVIVAYVHAIGSTDGDSATMAGDYIIRKCLVCADVGSWILKKVSRVTREANGIGVG